MTGIMRRLRRFFAKDEAAWPAADENLIANLNRAAARRFARVDLDRFRRLGISADPLDYIPSVIYPLSNTLPPLEGGDQALGEIRPPERVSVLYLHFPFCSYSCAFCRYPKLVLPDREFVESYLDALEREIDSASRWLRGAPIKTVFFGGGTPTFLLAEDLSRIVRRVSDRFCLDSLEEWTVEASPETVSPEKLTALVGGGVDRISMGVQSMNSALLRSLGRSHAPQGALAAVEMIRASGAAPSLDFIYGLPGQTLHDVEEDIRTIFRAGPCEVSWYQLEHNFDTPLRRKIASHPDRTEAMLRLKCLVQEVMPLIGRHRPANRRPSFYGRRNRERGDSAIGLGLGARSDVRDLTYRNCSTPGEYIKRMRLRGHARDQGLRLSIGHLLRREVMYGFHCPEGASLERIRSSRGDSRDEILRKVEACERAGLVTVRSGRLQPSSAGTIFSQCVANFIALTREDLHSPQTT